MIKWETKTIELKKLKPAIYNPRKANKKSKQTFIANQDKYGDAEPIVVNQDFTIIGGHMRYQIYLEKGLKEVEVSFPSRLLSQEEEKSLNIKLNSITGYSEVNKVMDLGLTLTELGDLGFDEIELPRPKENDKTNVIQGKLKNALIYNLYYFPNDFAFVQGVLNKIKDKYKCTQGQAVYKLITSQN